MINIDRINDDVPLSATVWRLVRFYLETNKITETEFDEVNLPITDWAILSVQVDSSSSDEETIDTAEELRGRFRLSFDVKGHKRSGLISTQLIELP